MLGASKSVTFGFSAYNRPRHMRENISHVFPWGIITGERWYKKGYNTASLVMATPTVQKALEVGYAHW
jgi:hypothetical protein